MFSAGAATSTGPCIGNELGIRSGRYRRHACLPAVRTRRGDNGLHIVPAAWVAELDGSGAGFCTQSPPVLPAATTTTPLTLLHSRWMRSEVSSIGLLTLRERLH